MWKQIETWTGSGNSSDLAYNGRHDEATVEEAKETLLKDRDLADGMVVVFVCQDRDRDVMEVVTFRVSKPETPFALTPINDSSKKEA
jgi:hypothetical protein